MKYIRNAFKVNFMDNINNYGAKLLNHMKKWIIIMIISSNNKNEILYLVYKIILNIILT